MQNPELNLYDLSRKLTERGDEILEAAKTKSDTELVVIGGVISALGAILIETLNES